MTPSVPTNAKPSAHTWTHSPIVPIRAVHLDLKGLPPTPARLLSLLDLFAALRYNAVLVEWEDMFPWTVDERFRCETAYSPEVVSQFVAKAKSLNIELIPLVQCLGHMETFLRPMDYAHLREIPDQCDGLNPLAKGARELVQRLVDDVLQLMPGIKYFHLGGDEAWTLGTHPDTKAFIAEHGKAELYLRHVRPLLDNLAERSIRPILWHDMMMEWDHAALGEMGRRADLCAWGYRGRPDNTGDHHSAARLQPFLDAKVPLWGAGAYKGADGSNIDLPNIPSRRENAEGWAAIAPRFHFRGLIATAWSRYNTNIQQCEPIDTSLDALALLGFIFHDGVAPTEPGAIDAALESAGELADFRRRRTILEQFSRYRRDAWLQVQDFRERRALIKKDPRRTGTSQPEKMMTRLSSTVQKLISFANDFRQAMSGAVDDVWITRYLDERIDPIQEEMADLQRKS